MFKLFSSLFKAPHTQEEFQITFPVHPEKSEDYLKMKKYFSLLERLEKRYAEKDFLGTLKLCEQSLGLLPSFVRAEKEAYGAFQISSIPAIEIGVWYWAAMGNEGKLANLKTAAHAIPELEAWYEEIDKAFSDLELALKIRELLSTEPGFLQNKLGKELGVHGKETAHMVHAMDNLGIIRKEREKKTYKLFLVVS